MSKGTATGRWLLLFHQIPPKPDYFRVKVWRRLQRIGAVPVKNSVWVLPYNDQAARFKFVAPEGYSPRRSELRFDMFEAEYTHEGDRCTFETLLRRFRLRDPALRAIGEIVHDIDCKDAKFERAEAAGVERLLAGIARKHASDAARLRLGAIVFDNLYQSSR